MQGEVQGVHQSFDTGPARNQVIGHVLASWFPKRGYLLDLGLGYYDQAVAVPKVDRDAVDLNIHWFPKSHIELVLMGRVQTIAFGGGGAGSGYGLLQFHYRIRRSAVGYQERRLPAPATLTLDGVAYDVDAFGMDDGQSDDPTDAFRFLFQLGAGLMIYVYVIQAGGRGRPRPLLPHAVAQGLRGGRGRR